MPDLAATVDLLGLLADPTRLRLLALVEDEELTVAELVRITELPQSRVSTHLGKLRQAGLLRTRREGSRTNYSYSPSSASEAARRAWELVRDAVDDQVLRSDRSRREAALQARVAAGGWPDEVAGQMDRHYSPGRTWEAMARGLVGLLDLGDVLDVGSGDGALARLLAPRARSITCVDRSPKVIEAARRRLQKIPKVRLMTADMHAMPFEDASFDQVLHFHVLTYSSDPSLALAEAVRVLRPGGDLVVVTLHEHEHEQIASAYSQVNNGFCPRELERMAADAGLEVSLSDITSRERNAPYFEVVTLYARKPGGGLRVVAS